MFVGIGTACENSKFDDGAGVRGSCYLRVYGMRTRPGNAKKMIIHTDKQDVQDKFRRGDYSVTNRNIAPPCGGLPLRFSLANLYCYSLPPLMMRLKCASNLYSESLF
jgi:hypothetical protein